MIHIERMFIKIFLIGTNIDKPQSLTINDGIFNMIWMRGTTAGLNKIFLSPDRLSGRNDVTSVLS